ncbi:MAG: 3-hydroxyanthranilate 3,4-dioxygenase [Phycisphaerae bacterium]|nr:3-hydroxyanthranilate 3,4-dioxygenase [Phycisphaerae bacterium]
MAIGNAFNFRQWIDEHRHLLKPPVGNKIVWEDTDIMVMVVGGPNIRKDFHINPTEEFYYQLEGNMTLRIREDGTVRDIPINEGDIFLLPPHVPHSPQRPANTVGLVIERRRPEGEHDHVRWYCEKCGEILHDPHFYLTNLGTQLKPVIQEFIQNEALRTCKHCGAKMEIPPPPKAT